MNHLEKIHRAATDLGLEVGVGEAREGVEAVGLSGFVVEVVVVVGLPIWCWWAMGLF